MSYVLLRTHNSTNATEYKSASASESWTNAKEQAQEYTNSASAEKALQQAQSSTAASENYTFALESTTS